MTWYAQTAAKRGRQLAADVVVVAWTALWVRLGVALHEAVSRLAAPSRALTGAGDDLHAAAAGAGEQVADLPLLGGALAAPFEAVAEAGRSLAGAGASAQELVAWLALWPVLAVVGPPMLLVVAVHVAGRLRWAREARAAEALRGAAGSEALLALRALAHRPCRSCGGSPPTRTGRSPAATTPRSPTSSGALSACAASRTRARGGRRPRCGCSGSRCGCRRPCRAGPGRWW